MKKAITLYIEDDHVFTGLTGVLFTRRVTDGEASVHCFNLAEPNCYTGMELECPHADTAYLKEEKEDGTNL